MLLVGLPEEPCVVETGAQNAFVTVPDSSLRVAIGIQNRQKVGQKLPVGIFDREVLLMVAHHRNEDLFRQFQKFWIEAAQYGRRPLGEVDDGIEQNLVFTPPCSRNRSSGR